MCRRRKASDRCLSSSPLPAPGLSPPLSNGTTHPMSTSLVSAARTFGHHYSAPYSMGRSHFSPTHSNHHDLNRYSGYSNALRPVDHFGTTFSSSSNSYNQSSPPMSLDISSRSSQNRQDGPPFGETMILLPVVTGRNLQLLPDIVASIQKGFFQVDRKWTCYRRNYFTVSCSFHFRTPNYDTQLYVQRHSGQQLEAIAQFAVSISAKTAVMNNQESELRNLVQHTPKRDKASESVPGKVFVQPAQPPSLNAASGMGTGSHLYASPQHVSPGMMLDYHSNFGGAPHQAPPTSHTFERIQFQKATANNGKRRAQQQYFHVVVELSADIGRPAGEPQWVKIATKESHPMVVRGRSPGHYKDNGRRNSSTSMDPDRETGAGGDGGSGQIAMPSLLGSGQVQASSMDWEPSHRNGSHLGGHYRSVTTSDCSPPSGASTDSSPESTSDHAVDLNERMLSASQYGNEGRSSASFFQPNIASSPEDGRMLHIKPRDYASDLYPSRMPVMVNHSQSTDLYTAGPFEGVRNYRALCSS